VNELGFELFSVQVQSKSPITGPEGAFLAQAVRERISNLELHDNHGHPPPSPPNYHEWREAEKLRSRLHRFFEEAGDMIVGPFFRGCGILNSCQGDVLSEETLFEVKAGDRPFRITDIRQLLIYAALNFESREHQINRLGLFNPRLGTYVTGDVEQFSLQLCGMSSSELFGIIVAFLSSSGVSR
jgi:hypothetical protein